MSGIGAGLASFSIVAANTFDYTAAGTGTLTIPGGYSGLYLRPPSLAYLYRHGVR